MNKNHSSSFRDPAGFMFYNEAGLLLRQVNAVGGEDYDKLLQSGLYTALVKVKLLIAHEPHTAPAPRGVHAIIRPQLVPFITYPFEWSFSQLKDAALTTLTIQQKALVHGMSLKDASAYNIQFVEGKPIFIDTLSFEVYEPGTPWKAYRQFCEHFLAPLALMAHVDVRLSQLLRIYLDGIPLSLTAKLLPHRTHLRPGILMHLFLHARAQSAGSSVHTKRTSTLSQMQMAAVIDNLKTTIRHLRPRRAATEWGEYYQNTNYTADAANYKAKLVRQLLTPLHPATVLDMGGNDGHYSRALHDLHVQTICADSDPNAVEANYLQSKRRGEVAMLPLLIDITNPGGAMGWANAERSPIQQRLQADAVMALALIHHLAIANNLPFAAIAEYFASFGPYLLIEFVPKTDSQVQKLLATREDVFDQYTEEEFTAAFGTFYTVEDTAPIPGTERTLYLLKRKD
jgi:ribosomal protein L11 methylase PrmA